MRFSTDITLAGERVEINVPRGSKAWRLANSVFCPLGPAPTKAWVVMAKRSVNAINKNGPLSLRWDQVTKDDEGDPPVTTTFEFQGMYFVRSERLLLGGVGDLDALHLVELADVRYLAQQKSDTGAIVSNIRSYARSADYLTGTSGDTWAVLVTALWNSCGLGAFPGLPGTLPIDGVPENNWFIGMNAWRALNAVLDLLDCAIAHNPFTGVYSIVQLGGAQTIDTTHDNLKWDAEPVSGNAAKVASTLKIYFYYHRKAYGQERDAELANNWAFNGQGASTSVATGVAGATGTVQLWDDLPLILNKAGTQTNAVEQGVRVANRQTRYVTRNSVSDKHQVITGLSDEFLPGGQVRACLWRNWYDIENPLGGTVTEYIAGSDLISSVKAEDSGLSMFETAVSLEREAVIAPDLARHSYPNYPRVSDIVQVHSISGEEPGAQLEPTNTGLHLGRIKRYIDESMQTLDNCWIKFVDNYDQQLGNIAARQDEYYGPARLSGIDTFGGFTFPLYLVKAGTGGEDGPALVYFRVLGDRASGTPTMAVHLEAAFNENNKPEDDFTVWDGNFFFPLALTGALGIAAYNGEEDRWDVILCQQRAIFAIARVNSANSPNNPQGTIGGMNGDVGLVTINSFQALQYSIFSQSPASLPTQAINRFGHMGRHQSELLLMWDQYQDGYIVIDVSKRREEVVFAARLNADKTQFQLKVLRCALEHNGDLTSTNDILWKDMIPTNKCDIA